MTSSNLENYLTLRDSHSVYVQDGTKNIFRVRNILRNDIQKVPLTNKPVALNAENLDNIIKHSVTLLVKHAGYVDMSADACEMLMNLVKKSLNETCKQFSISKRRRMEKKPTAFSSPTQHVFCFRNLRQVEHLGLSHRKRFIDPYVQVRKQWEKIIKYGSTDNGENPAKRRKIEDEDYIT